MPPPPTQTLSKPMLDTLIAQTRQLKTASRRLERMRAELLRHGTPVPDRVILLEKEVEDGWVLVTRQARQRLQAATSAFRARVARYNRARALEVVKALQRGKKLQDWSNQRVKILREWNDGPAPRRPILLQEEVGDLWVLVTRFGGSKPGGKERRYGGGGNSMRM